MVLGGNDVFVCGLGELGGGFIFNLEPGVQHTDVI